MLTRQALYCLSRLPGLLFIARQKEDTKYPKELGDYCILFSATYLKVVIGSSVL